MTRRRRTTGAFLGAAALVLAGCGSPHVGVGIPVVPGIAVGVGTGGVSVGTGVGSGPLGSGVRVDHRGRFSAGAGTGSGPVSAGVGVRDDGRVTVGGGAGVSAGAGGIRAGVGAGHSTGVADLSPEPESGRDATRRPPPSIWD